MIVWLDSLQVRVVRLRDSEAKRDKRKDKEGRAAPGSPPHLGGEWAGVG